MKVKHYCAPLNLNNNHWVTLDVSLPNEDFQNGRVMITNHMHNDGISEITNTKSMPTYYSQMWWAKYFGIYYKEKCGVALNNLCFSFTDMNCTSFTLKDQPKKLICSTLDHMANEDPNRGKQKDSRNCGTWVLMEMFNRTDKGYKCAIGTRTKLDLQQFRVKVFQLMISLYELMVEENYWLYDWRTNSVKNDVEKWRDIFTSSTNEDFNFNNRWILMKQSSLTGSASMSEQPPSSTTGTKRKTSTSSKKTPPVKGTLAELEAARSKRRNIKKKKVYADVNVEQEMKDGVWKEHLASNKIPPKRKMLEVPTKIIMAEFQALEALDAQAPVVSDNANIFVTQIGRVPIKLHGSNKFIDIVKEVNNFITTRFEIDFKECDRTFREPSAKKERVKFDNYVKKCVEDYTTYILVDEVTNND